VYFYTMLTPEKIYEVLENRRLELGLTQSQVSAKAFGRADSSAFQGIRRGASPSVQKLEALAKALGLEFRFGSIPEQNEHVTTTFVDGSHFSALPLYGVEASAGPGAENSNAEVVEMLAFRQEWLDRLGVKASKACLLKIRGDSMAPLLQHGDLALIDRSRTEIINGRTYAFVDIDGQTRLKRLEKIDTTMLILRSDNPDHLTEVRKSQDMNRLQMIGEVVWSGHTWR